MTNNFEVVSFDDDPYYFVCGPWRAQRPSWSGGGWEVVASTPDMEDSDSSFGFGGPFRTKKQAIKFCQNNLPSWMKYSY
jgi:hypothetical protein